MTVHPRDPYSFRHDPAVPRFDHDGPVAVMDANCGLCTKAAAWIARNDRQGAFRIVPIQGPLGAALARHYGLDPADPVTWLVIDGGRGYASFDAVIRASRYLGPWRVLAALRAVPAPLRDAVYRGVARSRYRLFGRADLCALPDPEVRRRLLG